LSLDHRTFHFQCSVALPPLHSFPTRRSSDLAGIDHLSPKKGLGLVGRGIDHKKTEQPGKHPDAHEPEREVDGRPGILQGNPEAGDRKSTRLNSSHVAISYAVFCLKKKKTAVV